MGTLSLMKAAKASEDVKESDFAQLNMSQLKAIGSRGIADDGASGRRRGSKSLLERKPLSSKLTMIPLFFSSRLIAWTSGIRRAGQLMI